MADFINDLNNVEIVPPLEKLGSVHATAALWKTVDIILAIKDSSWMFYARNEPLGHSNYFNDFERILHENAYFYTKHHPILKKEIQYFLRPIGLHICEWLYLNLCYIVPTNIREFLNCIRWTAHGTIDKRKSAESLVKTYSFVSFKLACYNCLENEVLRMWKELSPPIAQYYFSRDTIENSALMMYWVYRYHKNLPLFLSIMKNSEFLSLFPNFIIDDDFKSENLYTLMTKATALSGNDVATKYFYLKLSAEEKNLNTMPFLVFVINRERYNNPFQNQEFFQIVYFFFSHLQQEDKMTVLQRHTTYFLFSMFKHFSFQSRIVTTMSLMWDFLTVEDYSYFLYEIIYTLFEKKYVLGLLLVNIWKNTPEIMKRSFFTHAISHINFLPIFEKNALYITKTIVNDVNLTERNSIYSYFEI